MTTAKTKATRTKRTKTEVQEEFQDLVQEAAQAATFSNPKVEELLRQKDVAIREAVKEVNADSVVHKLAELNLEITKSLNTISEKIIAEVNSLSQLRQAVIIETEELSRLHKIDVAQTAVDELIEEFSTKKHDLETEIALLAMDLAKKQENRGLENKEYEESLKKTRQREVEEYEYKKTLERKKAHDKYEDEVRQKLKENLEKQELLEKNWQQRDVALKAQEEEIIALRKQVNEFPSRLKLEKDQAVAEAIKETNFQRSQELLLLKHSSDTEQKLAELKVKSFEDAINRYVMQVQTLEQQTVEAKKQVQEIAVKAIESASGANALNHVNQIAIEQAKVRQ